MTSDGQRARRRVAARRGASRHMASCHLAARRGVVLMLAILGLSLVWGQAESHATSYRYWTYWASDGGGWTFSQLGPAATIPKDGSVQGWRFTISDVVASADDQPRITPPSAFEAACAGVTKRSGHKRVAVAIDYGTTEDAPDGSTPPTGPRLACAAVPASASGAQVLSAVATPRTQSGLICGLDDYPATGCAAAVPSTRPERSGPESGKPTSGGGSGSGGAKGSAPDRSPSKQPIGKPADSSPADVPTTGSTPTASSGKGSQARKRKQDSSPSPKGPSQTPPSNTSASPVASAAQLPAADGGTSGPWGTAIVGVLILTAAGLVIWRSRVLRRKRGF